MVISSVKMQWEIILSPTPSIASIHKSRFAVVVLVECWMEAVYYYINGKMLNSTTRIMCFTECGYMAYATHMLDTRSIHAHMHSRSHKILPVIGKILNFLWEKCVTLW